MRSLNAGSLPADDLRNIFRQIPRDRFLVRVLGVVFAIFEPIENGPVTTAQADFRIDPGAVQAPHH